MHDGHFVILSTPQYPYPIIPRSLLLVVVDYYIGSVRMAQLPPKVPTTTQNWASAPTCWVDEFLDFSSVRRGTHRRSASDSIAFLEAPDQFLQECRRNNHNNNMMNGNGSFEKLDDDQLMYMFSDDIAMSVPPSSSNPSTPSSDQNSNNDEHKATPMEGYFQPKSEPGEVDSQFDSPADTIIDPKRVKRILANRQSAQKSRVRKLQYISELERSVTSLQTEVSALSPRVAFLDHQRLILNVDNSALKQRIAALAQDRIFKDAHQEALKKEIERLRQVYQQQSLKKMNVNNNNQSCNTTMEETRRAETTWDSDKEQLLIN